MIQLTNDVIDYNALTESVRSSEAGAVVLFLGTVREMTDGRQTIALDYEAFPQMAQAKLEELLVEARHKWPIALRGRRATAIRKRRCPSATGPRHCDYRLLKSVEPPGRATHGHRIAQAFQHFEKPNNQLSCWNAFVDKSATRKRGRKVHLIKDLRITTNRMLGSTHAPVNDAAVREG